MLRETFKRVALAGWTNFRRNSYVSFGTTGVMALVLLLFLGIIAFNFLSSVVLDSLQEKVDISLYFKTEATEADIMTVKKDLEALSTVRYVDYVSRDQALAQFKERHAGDTLIQESLAELEENPLQATLNIKAKDANQYASIVGFVEGHKLRSVIDKINFYENEQVISRIEGIATQVRRWAFGATALLIVIAVLVAFNTIRLTIYSQKQEIEIMRLVGGSNWFIRAPYMVEGAIYGTIAAGIALVVFGAATAAASSKIGLLIPGVSLIGYFFGNSIIIIFLTVLAGIGLGVVSSLIAIRRFLRI